MFETYYNDPINAVDAKFEAQKIAFAPLTFQAARALRDLGILDAVSESRKKGMSVPELSSRLGLSPYGVGVLVEMGLGMGALKLVKDAEGDNLRYTLGKIGFFLMKDEMTQVNMDFSQDICYLGAMDMQDCIKEGKPKGLAHLGPWKTVYEGLSQLTEQEKKSWFGFDHFYSDLAFPECLPIVYGKPVGRLFDIGGNTAKWAIASCRFNKDVKVSIVDLPGQTAVAQKNAEEAGFASRIDMVPCNVLDKTTEFPKGADAVWMSQFLDCFSLSEITGILSKISRAVGPETDIYVLEPLWDHQRFEAAAYSLQATSLYFTCIANGNSKMYRFEELKQAVEAGGFRFADAHHNLGPNSYSLLRFRKA
ncbi:MAG: class I SAM-dependent methyltransferase [Fibrobacteraceae bacterium]|nr:class I SAM-dependent methyltransferase [Fibrobacteraceae bacterium]